MQQRRSGDYLYFQKPLLRRLGQRWPPFCSAELINEWHSIGVILEKLCKQVSGPIKCYAILEDLQPFLNTHPTARLRWGLKWWLLLFYSIRNITEYSRTKTKMHWRLVETLGLQGEMGKGVMWGRNQCTYVTHGCIGEHTITVLKFS